MQAAAEQALLVSKLRKSHRELAGSIASKCRQKLIRIENLTKQQTIGKSVIAEPQIDLRKQPDHQRQEDSLDSLREENAVLKARVAALQRENGILTRRCMEEQRPLVQTEIATLIAERVPEVKREGGFEAWIGKFAGIKVLDEVLTTEVTSVLRVLGDQAKSQNQPLADAANQVLAALLKKYVALGQGRPFLDGIAAFEEATGCSLTHETYGAIGLSIRHRTGFNFTEFSVRQRLVPTSERMNTGSTSVIECRFDWHSPIPETSAKTEKP